MWTTLSPILYTTTFPNISRPECEVDHTTPTDIHVLTSWRFISASSKEGMEGNERKKGINKERKEEGRKEMISSGVVFMSLKIDITKSTM
jgi:hypothetical protein